MVAITDNQLVEMLLGRKSAKSVPSSDFSAIGIPPKISLQEKLKFLRAIYDYAPRVYLHSQDGYYPSSVPWLFRHKEISLYYRLPYNPRSVKKPNPKPPKLIVPPGKLSIDTLISQRYGITFSGSSTHAGATNFFINIPDKAKRGENKSKKPHTECYVHFRKAKRSLDYDIQYWFFYPFNPQNLAGVGHHFGDWEHITVRISPVDFAIVGVYFARHSAEGGWESYSTANGFHIQVYSAKASHASYPTAGTERRGAAPDDHRNSNGAVWDTWKNLVLVGERHSPRAGQEWINFTGRWGSSGGRFGFGKSPETPAIRDDWNDDSGPHLLPLVEQGHKWRSIREGTDIAFGRLGSKDIVGVTKNAGKGHRVSFYQLKNNILEEIGGIGGWNEKRSATGIAFGKLGGKNVIGVTKSPGKGARAMFYQLVGGKFKEIANVGGWNEKRGATDIAFGKFGKTDVVGITKNAGKGPRVVFYKLERGRLIEIASVGQKWGSNRGATAIAFGTLGGKSVVGVTRSKGDNARVLIYRWNGQKLVEVASEGQKWGKSRAATSISFGKLGGKQVVGVTRSSGDNERLLFYTLHNNKLRKFSGQGRKWGDERSATAIAFGNIDGTDAAVVTRSKGKNSRVIAYAWKNTRGVGGSVVEHATAGDRWGGGRGANAVALGTLGKESVIGVTRNTGNHARVVLYHADKMIY